MNNKKKILLINILFLLIILSGCNFFKKHENNRNNSEKEIRFFKIFGKKYNNFHLGSIRNAELFEFYTNFNNLQIYSTIFKKDSKQIKRTEGVILELKSELGNFFGVGFHDLKNYEFDKIILETNEGMYYLNAEINTSTELYKSEEQLSDIVTIINYSYSVSSFFDYYETINFGLKIKSEEIEILDIDLYEKNKFPTNLNIEKIHINKNQFPSNKKKFIYNKDEIVDIDISFSKYFIGNYIFKISYKIHNEERNFHTAPIVIDHFSGMIKGDENYKKYREHLNMHLKDENLTIKLLKK